MKALRITWVSLGQIASADRRDDSIATHKIERLKVKIGKLNDEIKKLNKIESQLNDIPSKQVSLTDPDARSMATSGRGTGVVGYNVQAAVLMLNITLSWSTK